MTISNISYYNFKQDWDNLFVPILDKGNSFLAKRYILLNIEAFLSTWKNNKDVKEKYSNIIDELDVMTDIESRLAYIDSFGWSKFFHFHNLKHDEAPNHVEHTYFLENLYEKINKDEYNNSKKLEHYFFYHDDQLIAMLIWTWCREIWPNKEWLIADNGSHAWVVEKNKENVIYDILYQYCLELSADKIYVDKVCYYSDPLHYFQLYGIFPVDVSLTKADRIKSMLILLQADNNSYNTKFLEHILNVVDLFTKHFPDYVIDDVYKQSVAKFFTDRSLKIKDDKDESEYSYDWGFLHPLQSLGSFLSFGVDNDEEEEYTKRIHIVLAHINLILSFEYYDRFCVRRNYNYLMSKELLAAGVDIELITIKETNTKYGNADKNEENADADKEIVDTKYGNVDAEDDEEDKSDDGYKYILNNID